jgi:hypothetical protein
MHLLHIFSTLQHTSVTVLSDNKQRSITWLIRARIGKSWRRLL